MEKIRITAPGTLASGMRCRQATWRKTVLNQRYLLILVLPAVIWMFIFNYIPMYGLVIAFKKYNVFTGILNSPWTGLDNFREMFQDPGFYHTVWNTLKISVLKLIFGFPLPIAFAIFLNEMKSASTKKFIQTVSYLPYFISWAFVVSFMYILFSPTEGLVNELLVHLHLVKEPIFFLGEPKPFLALVIGSDVWKNLGWNAVIYFAAIVGIDPQLYEAAMMDGAGRFRRMIHITLPALKPTVMMLLILNISYLLGQNFDQLFLMQNSLTKETADIIDIYTYTLGLAMGRFSYATAVGLFRSLIAATLLLSSNFLSRKITGESLF